MQRLLLACAMTKVGTPMALAQYPVGLHVEHGAQLTARHVGPAAAGLLPQDRHPGGEIKDGVSLPYARSIERMAVYDGISVEGPHLLIERIAFTGPVDVYTKLPVVFRGVDFRVTTAAPWALQTRPGAGRVIVLWSRAGAASVDGAPADRTYALSQALYLRSDGVTVFRCHIESAADGIQIHAAGARIIETLVDNLVEWTGDHNDGIQMLGEGRDVEIVRARIVNPNPQTSALNLIGDDVRVTSSYLAGGGWTLYAGLHLPPRRPGMTHGVIVEDTIFGRDHFPRSGGFGPVTGWDAAGPGNRWLRNRFSDGRPIEMTPAR